MAYIAYPEHTVWRMRPDGSDRKQLIFAPLEADGLDWSPDARTIAVRARQPGKPYKIYLVGAAGGEPHELLPDRRQEEGVPSWSPDGRRIAFGDVPLYFGEPAGNEVIHVYDLATQRLSVLPGSGGLWTARWSPDGRYLAAISIASPAQPPSRRLALFEVATQRWRGIAVDFVETPIWSRDSHYIYLLHHPRALEFFWSRVRIPDGTLEEITNLNDVLASAGFVNRWIGLGPDDSPVFLRNRTSEDIYSLDVDWP